MKKANYEFRALLIGVILNFISTFLGIAFYTKTQSSSMLLDAVISAILFGTTIISLIVSNNVNKRETSRYPLGRYAIENMFLLFRSIMMLGTVAFSIIQGVLAIYNFFIYNGDIAYDATNKELITYGLLMTILCLSITTAYLICYKKTKGTSEIIKLELKGSIYDELVTFFAIGSLLLFANVSFLEKLAPIADSIVVILLSIFYAISPSKELFNQIKVLIDERRFKDKEDELINYLKEKYNEYDFFDLYFSYTGNIFNIYITLLPKEDKLVSEINKVRDSIYEYLYKEYNYCKVYLIFDERRIHKL